MEGLKVLMVDDEVIFCENMTKLLNTRGYQAKAVNEGEEAIRVLKKEAYDVVVLDLKMPGMDGIDILKKMKAHYGFQVVIEIVSRPKNLKATYRAFSYYGQIQRILNIVAIFLVKYPCEGVTKNVVMTKNPLSC